MTILIAFQILNQKTQNNVMIKAINLIVPMIQVSRVKHREVEKLLKVPELINRITRI